MKLVQAAVPIFLALIALEVFLSHRRGKKFYRLHDSIVDLSTALIFSFSGLFIAAGALYLYNLIETNFSLQVLAGLPALPHANPFSRIDGFPWINVDVITLLSWIAALLVVDFIYYWFHRAAHQINFLWACHVTHHSSEDFNLTVALRQCGFQRIFEYAFYMPLALAGIPWWMLLTCHGILKLFQFWVHTRFIKDLGFFEKVFLTPAHHRVHHGRDPRYIDKNHGGILILWDKLFGTFAQETVEPRYGLAKPLNSWNPVHANIHVYTSLFRDIAATHNWSDKVRLLLKPPGWKPEDLGGPVYAEEVAPDYRPFHPIVPKNLTRYALGQFILMIVGGLLTLRLGRALPAPAMEQDLFYFLLGAGGFVVLGLVGIGAVMENKPWAWNFEFLRLSAGLLIGASLAFGGLLFSPVAGMIFVLLCLLSLCALLFFRGDFAFGDGQAQRPEPPSRQSLIREDGFPRQPR